MNDVLSMKPTSDELVKRLLSGLEWIIESRS